MQHIQCGLLLRASGSAFIAAAVSMCVAHSASAQRLDKDTNEAVLRIHAKTKDAYSNPVDGEITVTMYKPDGPGPFPLVVINHGRGNAEERKALRRARYTSISRYFVRKGFVVALPLRFGYGDQLPGDPEDGQPCNQSRHDVSFNAAADQILAVIENLQKQSFVDPDRLVIVGHSVGGFSTLAAAARRPRGLVATVNFAGGKGGQPDVIRGVPCGSPQLAMLAAQYAEAATAKKSLWIYNENDSYFNLSHAATWHKSFNSGGGQAKLYSLPPHGKDGHNLFLFGADVWQPLLDPFLAEVGFDRPGVIQSPPPTDYAPLDDASSLPNIAGKPAAVADYAKFLNLPEPRAFAIGPFGTWGFSSGDDAMSKALMFCQRELGSPCKFYAVDKRVVWAKP